MKKSPVLQNNTRSHLNSGECKNGFYEIAYMINSPQQMTEYLKKLPFVKYNPDTQVITAKTPFLNIITCHRNIKDEIFAIYSEASFKANVCFKYRYDQSVQPEYYCLSLRIDYYSKNINSLANGVGYSDHSWLIFKPGAKVDHHHFKGTTGKYVSVYFKQSWLEKHLGSLKEQISRELRAFMVSERDYLICPHLPGNDLYSIEHLAALFNTMAIDDSSYQKKLKKEMLRLFDFFIAQIHEEGVDEKHFKVSNLERIKVLKTAHLLKSYFYKKFPGITYLSKEAGLSETKLKKCFKLIYDQTLLQYFQTSQMEKAYELIESTSLPIAKIAECFCYGNTSKFAGTFKRHFGLLPSEVEKR